MNNSPIKYYTSAQVKEIERRAIASDISGYALMKQAGQSAFAAIIRTWPKCKLCVICGGGNNGGDGFVVAKLAHEAGLEVHVYFAKNPTNLIGEAKMAAEDARQACVPMSPLVELGGFNTSFDTSDGDVVIVDALLGTGLSGKSNPLRADYSAAIQWMNKHSAPKFSIDLPSGLCSDTGAVMDICVDAHLTLSFIGRKRGLFTHKGPDHRGICLFDSLNVPCDITEQVESNIEDNRPIDALRKLSRPRTAHKGNTGHVAIIGGGMHMGGAAIMAAEASLYSGAGLVSLFTRKENVAAAQVRIPEVMSNGLGAQDVLESDDTVKNNLARASVFCVGPGLGQGLWAQQLFQAMIEYNKPMVLDADALNLMAQSGVKPYRDSHVLTPHPGEAARLLNKTIAEIQNNRFSAVLELQKRFGGVVLLKGAGTLITDGKQIWINAFGNPGMAVGGMGDILAGVIAALIAQGLSILEATKLGACAHSLAADQRASTQGEIGLRATELLTEIRLILNAKTNIPK